MRWATRAISDLETLVFPTSRNMESGISANTNKARTSRKAGGVETGTDKTGCPTGSHAALEGGGAAEKAEHSGR